MLEELEPGDFSGTSLSHNRIMGKWISEGDPVQLEEAKENEKEETERKDESST